MKKVLVCGGAGYIGCHVVRRLNKAGYEVVVLDNLEKGHVAAIKDIAFVKGDINNKADIKKVLKDNGFSCVMHFAANSQVGESMEKPVIYYRNNVAGTLNLIEAMLDEGINNFIFSSTAAVYGEPTEIPITEEHATIPTNPYGSTKLVIEGMLNWFSQIYGFKYISLRYFNAAGADPAGDIGEDHSPETHLIPLLLKNALGIGPKVQILGTDYPTPDGTCVRDYIHVNDLADAHILALERLLDGGKSAIYNLGNDKGFSVLEVIKTAEEIVGKSIKVLKGVRRPGDPAVLVASSNKIRVELGWQPKYSELKKIIATAWNWHSNNPSGYLKPS